MRGFTLIEGLVVLVIVALLTVMVAPLAFGAGCGPEVDPTVQTEKAKVLQTCFNPGTHGTGLGITTGGDVAITSVDVQPAYAVVFECQHGRFIIEDHGRGSRAHKLWEQLKEGQQVTVAYQEKFRTRDGRREVVGYKFLDAR